MTKKEKPRWETYIFDPIAQVYASFAENLSSRTSVADRYEHPAFKSPIVQVQITYCCVQYRNRVLIQRDFLQISIKILHENIRKTGKSVQPTRKVSTSTK